VYAWRDETTGRLARSIDPQDAERVPTPTQTTTWGRLKDHYR
jgi:hypothetical protein